MIDLESIRSGLNRGEFFVEYLPTIALNGGNCVGAEALTRWRRDSGIVNPFDSMELIRDTPLSGRITYWVIETVARELGAWLRAHPDAHIAINVPPEILGRGGLEYAATSAGLNDLLDQIKEGKVKLDDVKEEELPEEMKKLKPEERKEYLKKLEQKRDELRKKILELDRKRSEYIAREQAKQSDKGKDGFDSQVLEILRKQAKKHKINY